MLCPERFQASVSMALLHPAGRKGNKQDRKTERRHSLSRKVKTRKERTSVVFDEKGNKLPQFDGNNEWPRKTPDLQIGLFNTEVEKPLTVDSKILLRVGGTRVKHSARQDVLRKLRKAYDSRQRSV